VTRSLGHKRNSWLIFTCLAVAIVLTLLDQLSKKWALDNLGHNETKPIIGDFLSFHLIFNPGAAFSLGEGATWIFTVISLVIVAAAFWLLFSGRTKSFFVSAVLGMVIGGAVGNLLDRFGVLTSEASSGFGQGHVVDFISYGGWFVGNVADIWIVVGVVLFVGYSFVKGEPAEKIAADE